MEDGLIKDGFIDVYNKFYMGNCVENIVKKYNIIWEQQDEYVMQFYKNVQVVWVNKVFVDEIVLVIVIFCKGDKIIDIDEGYFDIKFEKVFIFKFVFVCDGIGIVIVVNFFIFNDGVSVFVFGNCVFVEEYGFYFCVFVCICGYVDVVMDFIDFFVVLVKVVLLVFECVGIIKDQVVIWEFNEVFVGVVLVNLKILGFEGVKVNFFGGVIFFGYVLGSFGLRIFMMLLYQLKFGEYGVVVICNGGGVVMVVVVQRIELV